MFAKPGSGRSMALLWWLAMVAAMSLSGSAWARSLPDFTSVVEDVSGAVVNISTTQKQKTDNSGPHGRMPDFPEGTPFDEFFRRFFGEGGELPEEFDARSLGSGFIISHEGYILTNNHVIDGADEIIVRLNDRREFLAELVGSDPQSDVAVLKIEAEDLPVVRIGDSARLKVGEWVLAIGSPFDFDHTVTAGIVSALGRSLPSENYVPFIQTDVAINPGNSGGPLLNLDGEVVGVNAQIYSRTGGFMGLSFTIPINLAMDVVEQLQTKGHVTRGWLGVFIQDVTRELAESFDMKKPEGALVSRVLPDSPAAVAGLEVGDVIVEFNGRPVANSSALPPIVGVTEVGKEVPVRVMRNGKMENLSVTIGELPPDEEITQATVEPEQKIENRMGVTVTALTPQQREELGIAQNGVLVEQVGRGPAFRAGIRGGDVITKINNVDIRDPEHFRSVVKDLPTNQSVAVLVQRRGGPLFVAMKLDE